MLRADMLLFFRLGQSLQLGNYGTLPYEDLMKGMAWLLEDSPYAANIDRERLAAAGASYGGYMINWIAGHNHNQTYKSVAHTVGFFFFSLRPCVVLPRVVCASAFWQAHLSMHTTRCYTSRSNFSTFL
jgi:hypothetical protein